MFFAHNISGWIYPVVNGNTREYCEQDNDKIKCASWFLWAERFGGEKYWRERTIKVNSMQNPIIVFEHLLPWGPKGFLKIIWNVNPEYSLWLGYRIK